MDLEALRLGAPLIRESRTLGRFDVRSIDNVVSSILRADNVSFLSWGVKRVRLDGKVHVIPAIMRRRTRAAIFEKYLHETTLHCPRDATVSESTFYRIASTITVGDSKLLKAVDYVVGFLVNDAADMLKQVVQDLDEHQQLKTLQQIDYNVAYLKYGFDARLNDPSSEQCILHQIEYGLLQPATDKTDSAMCCDCKEVFGFYKRLEDHLVDAGATQSTFGVVDDCRDKAQLFFGHRLRVVNQQHAIAKLVQQMRERCVQQGWSDEALVVIDFKMKLEPLYFREKTVDHYGKRGMSWHGALVQHFVVHDDREEDGVVDQRLYFDHISQGDTKQDREAVISMIEAILMRIKRDLPQVKRIVIQSDNASAYQNTLLPLLFPYLSVVHGILVSRFIHTETQDGKGVLDAHFARSMQVLRSWVREDNNCITPTQAVVGLKNNGGLPNCVVELVDHDRTALHLLTKEVEVIEKEARRLVKRANDVHFELTSMQVSSDSESGYRACPDFSLTVFEYSGIGSGCTVLVSPCAGSCALQHPSSATDNFAELQTCQTQGSFEEECHGDEIDDEVDGASDEDDRLAALVDGGDDVNEDDIDIEEAVTDDPDTIDPDASHGPVTGVKIATQGQIRQRIRRWRRALSVPSPTLLTWNARDAVSYALRRVTKMQLIGELVLRDPRTSSIVVERQTEHTAQPARFSPGWAIRPKKGSMYGKRYAAEFRAEIEELYLRGERNKAHKLGSGSMVETLRTRHPGRFDLPTENEIRQEIAKIRQRKSNKSTPLAVEVMSTERDPSNPTMRPRDTTAYFNDLLDSDPTIKPKNALVQFRLAFTSDILTDQQVKSKFSNVKSQRRNDSRE